MTEGRGWSDTSKLSDITMRGGVANAWQMRNKIRNQTPNNLSHTFGDYTAMCEPLKGK